MAIPARRLSTLPLPAAISAIQIVQSAAKPNVTVNELTELCQKDPALGARVLAYVNSTGFGLNRRVTGIQHAVALLGIRGTRNLALAMCVVDMAPQGEAGNDLLTVCLRRGVTAKLLAEKLGRPNIDDYFALGLLLDVGLLIKARNDVDACAKVARSPAQTRITLERAAGQEDHAKLGARLARSWQLGEEIANAILQHHDRPPPSSQLGTAAWLTESMAAVFESGEAAKSRSLAIEAAVLIDVPANTIDDILRSAPLALTNAARHFGRELGPQASIDALLRDTNEALVDLNRNYAEVMRKLEALLKEKDDLATALKQADEKLSTLALTDELTGLPNQRAFREALIRDLARADRAGTAVALIVLEVDLLTQLKETHGAASGDIVLYAIAEVVQRSLRTTDVPARIGAEKFALILPSTNVQGAMVVAERTRALLAAYDFTNPQGAFQVTASLGIAVTTGPGCRGREDALMAAADSGLEMAKQAGRNRFMVGSL